MSALSIQPTYPIFTDIDGQPLEDGYVWIGTANLDPQTNPINVYWDAALTLPAAQPIRTLAGYPANSGTPARLYVNSDYSIRVMNKNGSAVYSAPAATERFGNLIDASGVMYQPGGVGAVQTTVESRLRQFISVLDFGADPTGVLDSSTAVQNALYYAQSLLDDSLWYSDKTNPVVVFPPGTYAINTTVYTIGNVTLLGQGASITSTLNDTTPVFETAYVSGGSWVSNASLPLNVLLADVVTNLRFESLMFRSVGLCFKLRGATWQSHIQDCSFYYCGQVVKANNCFYFNYQRIMAYGSKSIYFDAFAKFELTEAVNRVSFNKVSISEFSVALGAAGGIGISIANGSTSVVITESSFEVGNIAIQLTDIVYDLVIQGNYYETLGHIVKCTDDDPKQGILLNAPSGYQVSFLLEGSNVQDSVIYAYQDTLPGQEFYRGVVKLTAGANGNKGTTVYQDAYVDPVDGIYKISPSKYQVTSDVRLVPNDWALESGSNADGNWVKFPNGVMIQYMTKTVSYTATVPLFITLPTSFKDTQYVVSHTVVNGNFDSGVVFGINTAGGFKLVSSNTEIGQELNFVATGRWK